MHHTVGTVKRCCQNATSSWCHYYLMVVPFAVTSGGRSLQKVLSMEFGGSLTSSDVEILKGGPLSTNSHIFESDKTRHLYLHHLVVSALTLTEVSQAAAEKQVSKMMMTKANNE